jgi:hypothetical protein
MPAVTGRTADRTKSAKVPPLAAATPSSTRFGTPRRLRQKLPQDSARAGIKRANYNEKCYALSSLSLLRREPWQSK